MQMTSKSWYVYDKAWSYNKKNNQKDSKYE